MANRLAMDVMAGLSSLAPEKLVNAIDPRDVHVGVENAWAARGMSDQDTYNRKALPWEGGAYTLVGGSWRKVAGRPNAVTGPAVESRFPNLASVWQQFARAQQGRPSESGSLEALRGDLVDAAQSISTVGQISPEQGEGTSIRAMKQRSKGRGSPGAEVGG